MRDEPPFPREKVQKHKSLGVHAPDPLRDDPNHPHSRLGPDHRKSNFADGGVIGESDLESEFAFGGTIGAMGGAIRNAFGKVRADQAVRDPSVAGRNPANLVKRRRNAPPRPAVKPNVGNLGPEFKDGGKVKARYPNQK